MNTGTVTIEIDPCPSPAFAEAVRKVCVAIISAGVVGMRNGNVTLHFDNDGNLRLIDGHRVMWRNTNEPAQKP